jgi:hypothetical protein
MRLASGIAPVMKYLASGVKVGLGVDGSARNDASNIVLEARQARLLARLGSAQSFFCVEFARECRSREPPRRLSGASAWRRWVFPGYLSPLAYNCHR